MAPSSFPNDGVVVINPLNSSNDFDGFHLRPPFEKTRIEGHFTAATGNNPDHIKFSETYNGVTYEYEAYIIRVTTDYYVTYNGKRRPVPGAADDDWVGTHTT